MDAGVLIRPEAPGERAAIRALNDAAFGRSVEGAIVDDIRGTDRWIDGGSLVAVDAAGDVVGHLLVSEGDLATTHGVRPIWMIGPVAVAPAVQRQGIGGRLVRAAIDLATGRAQPVLLLLGHPTYYPRFGFEPARPLGILPPNPGWPDEAWLALRLAAWTPGLAGMASYPPAFPID